MIDRRTIAGLMTEMAGRSIVAEEMSFDAGVGRYAPSYNGEQLQMLAKVFKHYAAHGLGANDLTLRAILGRPPRTMREFLRDLASSAVR